MATKKATKSKGLNDKTSNQYGEPKYPYTLTPGSLRKVLTEIPNRPKPPTFNKDTLRSWGFMNSNDQYNIRVLKAIGMLDSSNAPTQKYTDFMMPVSGAASLGQSIKQTYPKLFDTILDPSKASDEELMRFFRVNSGGSEETLRLQKETLKALISYATFGDSDALTPPNIPVNNSESKNNTQQNTGPTFNISLHIHLPENKTKADYESIIDRIGEVFYKTGQ